MSKILDAFRKFKQDMHEVENGEKLNTMSPQITVYDMYHQFSSLDKQHGADAVKIFGNILEKQPNIYHYALNNHAYSEENAQNRVLMHGIVFKTLFNMYLNHFKKGFDNIFLEMDSLSDDCKVERISLFYQQYYQLPKRYRGIFVQYDADSYVLNVPHADMIIGFNKKNAKKLEALLLRAKTLIPVIYKTKTKSSMGTTDLRRALKIATYEEPALVSSLSPAAKCVSDEQLNTIRELHDIFVEIAKITRPIKIEEQDKSRDVFLEFKREMDQKDIFVKASDTVKFAKEHREECLANAERVFNQKKQSIDESYKNMREDLFEQLSAQTSVRIK